MMNRVTVTIAGKEYNLVASEDENYVRKVANYVDTKIQAGQDERRLSLADSAVLAALDLADEFFKEQETNENLRRQIKKNAEDATQLEMELSEAKREIFRLENNRK